MKSKNLLEYLINEHLSSVEFVQDYLQLHFEDKTLTCYVWPSIRKNEYEYRSNHTDYKNQLCSLITENVTNVILLEQVSLTITLTNASEIILSLDSSNPEIEGEIAILSDDENNWNVFE
ncbi:MAG: hypothetical protein WKF97_15955 [Chitinophagaceae bacterium]